MLHSGCAAIPLSHCATGVCCAVCCVPCVQLSKEVRRLRGYERGLVTSYQHYLNGLEETLHQGFPLSQRTPPTKTRKKGQSGVTTLLGGRKLTEASMRVRLARGHRPAINRPWATNCVGGRPCHISFPRIRQASQFMRDMTPFSLPQSLASVGLKCLCELVVALPHFNFSTNILTVIIPYLDHKKVSSCCYGDTPLHLVHPTTPHPVIRGLLCCSDVRL